MQITLIFIILTFGIPALLIVGAVLLQIFLSKNSNKWVGLILPIIAFLYSITMVLQVAVFDVTNISATLIKVLTVFIITNIPTVILLTIYFTCRNKIKIRTQIDKMNIQDLD